MTGRLHNAALVTTFLLNACTLSSGLNQDLRRVWLYPELITNCSEQKLTCRSLSGSKKAGYRSSADESWPTENSEGIYAWPEPGDSNHDPDDFQSSLLSEGQDITIPGPFLPTSVQAANAQNWWDTMLMDMEQPDTWPSPHLFPGKTFESSQMRAIGLSALIHPFHKCLRTLQIHKAVQVGPAIARFDQMLPEISAEMSLSSTALLYL